MTTEEMAVIEAADKWFAPIGQHFTRTHGSCWEYDLAQSVRALRESRKPKPRYSVQNIRARDWNTGVALADVWDNGSLRIVAKCECLDDAVRVCGALNAEAERAGEEDR